MESSRKLPEKTPPLNDRVVLGDCLDVLATQPEHFADLVYVDPPFFTQKDHSLKTRDRSRTFAFTDIWSDSEEYEQFLLDRLHTCWKALKPSGSIFFHCDRNAVHIARALLDSVFGVSNFRSEIIWHYRRWSNSRRGLLPSHQNILYYTKSDAFTFNTQYTDYSLSTNVDQILQQRERDSDGKSVYRRDDNGLPIANGAKHGVPLGDVWDIPYLNPKAKERVGYPTQKPILLLDRIIEIASNPQDFVLDPFCGSGTTLVAAHLANRRYLGIDVSCDAIQLATDRLNDPMRSESMLLNNGRESYRNSDDQLLKYIHAVPHIPVQRNRGIDAILKAEFNGRPVLVRIQRPNETIDECAALLCKAARMKDAGLLLVVKTNDVKAFDFFDDSPDGVTVIDSTPLAIEHTIESLTSTATKEGK